MTAPTAWTEAGTRLAAIVADQPRAVAHVFGLRRPVVLASYGPRPPSRRRAYIASDEYPRFVQMAVDSFDRMGLHPHPSVVDFLAVCLIGEVEQDRLAIANKIDEVADERTVVTASELQWIASSIREAARDLDGDFMMSTSGG